MQLIVLPAVVIVFLEALADHEPVAIRVDRDVASIEQFVDIGTQKNAVCDVVGMGV